MIRLINHLQIADALTQKKSPNHKHKKHHRKHKKKKPNNEPSTDEGGGESDAVDVTNVQPDDTPTTAATLRADLNITPPVLPHSGANITPPMPVASSSRSTPASGMSSVAANALNASVAAAAKRKRGRNNKADSATSSEEERWLNAIESGKLEQVDDEMKKLKDPKLMTARQRAMYERSTAATASAMNTTTVAAAPTDEHGKAGRSEASPAFVDEQLVALPSGYKETKVLSAEDIEKALVKSQKRKQLADEKREKNKRKTMERLLKKKDYKATAKANKSRPTTAEVPMISWRSGAAGTTISFPPGVEPLPHIDGRHRDKPAAAEVVMDGPAPVVPCGRVPCAICGEPKRYNCSRTHVPLCSFECYEENVAALKQIMC